MRDRYYILLLFTIICFLSGWLVMNNNTLADVVTYSQGVIVPKDTNAKARVDLVRQAAAKKVLGDKVLAATTTQNNLVELTEVFDPIQIRSNAFFETTASSALVMNDETGSVLWGKSDQEVRSLASISKLFTAMVFLDYNPGWDKIYKMRSVDRREGGRVYLWSGEQVKVKDLFYLSLVASGNSETIALVNATGLGEELFVAKMNEKAHAMGLGKTFFKDPVGLSEANVSTAREVAKFAREALKKEEIKKVVKVEKFKFKTLAGREVVVRTTDELVGNMEATDYELIGGKTGYNNRAGYCFVGQFKDKQGKSLISVVLGEASKKSRFSESLRLIDWTYQNFAWPEKY